MLIGDVQGDKAMLMCELGNCHLLTRETSVGQTGRTHCFIFRFYLKTICVEKVNRVSENGVHI
jgi:hypothetical protein